MNVISVGLRKPGVEVYVIRVRYEKYAWTTCLLIAPDTLSRTTKRKAHPSIQQQKP